MTDLAEYPRLELKNESDVEQKFVFPLLRHPSFLGIPARKFSQNDLLYR